MVFGDIFFQGDTPYIGTTVQSKTHHVKIIFVTFLCCKVMLGLRLNTKPDDILPVFSEKYLKNYLSFNLFPKTQHSIF
jgi:hypothetical protein